MQGTLEAIRANCIEEGECWIWQGAMSHGTTPVMRIDGEKRLVSVRRHILEVKGVRVAGRKAYPSCGNAACVNPEHTLAMTSSQMLTRVAASTGYAKNLARNAKISAGKRRHSPLTPELVHEIRSSPESGHAIARRLGLSQSTVQAIRVHESWKDYRNPYLQLAA